jgi:RND superfamily putative drug exporter
VATDWLSDCQHAFANYEFAIMNLTVGSGFPSMDVMAALARWCFRRRRIVLAAWIVALIGFGALSAGVGAKYANNFSLPQTDSTRALNILKADFPSQAGDSDQIVVQARTGTLRDPAIAAQVNAMLAKVSHLPFVTRVTSPYSSSALISRDGTIGLATVNLNQQPQNVTKGTADTLIHTAQSFASGALNIQLGGAGVTQGQRSSQGQSELLGFLFALIILYFAFRRSLLSAILPLISAAMAIGVGTGIIGLLTHVTAVPLFGPILAVLVALGVGVDYALFIITRHRKELLAGRSPEDAAVTALNTSGRAVLTAGLIVCVALLGMFALQVSFLYGVALSAALVVLLTMLASLTLLPAMLGFIGFKVLRRKDRARLLQLGPEAQTASGFWDRWATLVQARSVVLSGAALAIIVVLALPFFSMRLGLSDAGNDPTSSTTRQAYDLLAKGFGPGFAGPFTLVGELRGPGDLQPFEQLLTIASHDPDVASVGAPRVSPNGQAVVASLYPKSSPSAASTTALLNRIRHTDIPQVEHGGSLIVHVGGFTAGGQDFSHILSSKLPQFVGIVVILAFLLLAAVFRSLLIPITASIMNLLSIGAALGVMTASFQYGWAKSVLNLPESGPIDVFVPVLLFAILFGLSMDYEVFLVSRMHEEWVHSGDNRRAVIKGQAETGRVITAAALIMIFVFASFVFGGQRVIKEVGIGFSAAIFLDAFVIRTVLVPSLMHLFGRANWWLPGWLDRILPTVHVEPEDLDPVPPQPAGVGS